MECCAGVAPVESVVKNPLGSARFFLFPGFNDYEKCCKHFWALGVVVLYYILLAVMGGSIGHGAINFSVFIE